MLHNCAPPAADVGPSKHDLLLRGKVAREVCACPPALIASRKRNACRRCTPVGAFEGRRHPLHLWGTDVREVTGPARVMTGHCQRSGCLAVVLEEV